MKLQIALDLTDLKTALKITEKTKKYIDIIELGTPLIKSEGAGIVKYFKKFKKPIVTDFKIMDTGFLEAELAFKKGADIITVCSCADRDTIIRAVKAARKYNKKVIADLISSKNLVEDAINCLKLGVDYICLHTSIDVQMKQKDPSVILTKNLAKLDKIIPKKKLIVAGGINLNNVKHVMKYNPAIVIVGGAITKNKNPEKIAKNLKEILR